MKLSDPIDSSTVRCSTSCCADRSLTSKYRESNLKRLEVYRSRDTWLANDERFAQHEIKHAPPSTRAHVTNMFLVPGLRCFRECIFHIDTLR